MSSIEGQEMYGRVKPHFWAKLQFESSVLPKKPGWRPNLQYPDIRTHNWTVWPLWRDGEEWGFFPLDPDLWSILHRDKIRPGTTFSLVEGSRVMARGVVTRIVEECF